MQTGIPETSVYHFDSLPLPSKMTEIPVSGRSAHKVTSDRGTTLSNLMRKTGVGRGGDSTKNLVLGYRLHFGGRGEYWVVTMSQAPF